MCSNRSRYLPGGVFGGIVKFHCDTTLVSQYYVILKRDIHELYQRKSGCYEEMHLH
jgi:hypothetical protein